MIYYNEKDLFAYFANTLVGSVYYGETLIYGPPTSTDDALIVITPDKQGLVLKQGLPIQYLDYTTDETGTEVLSSDIEIPNLTEGMYSDEFYWDPPSMVNTTYGTNLGTTNVTSDSWSGIGNLDRANVVRYFNGSGVSFSGKSTKTNCLIDAYSFSCSGMTVGDPYYIVAGCCIRDQSSNWTYGSTRKVYLVDLTNKVIIKEQTAITNLFDRTDNFYVTYNAPSTSITFGIIYEFDSIVNNYSGSRTLSMQLITGSSYTRSTVQPVSYTYNYNKVYTLSLDAYKFDPEYPVNIEMTYRETGTPIATYKVNEDNVVYDLELIQ